MSTSSTTAGQAPTVESFRERIARHLEGPAPQSNFEYSITKMAMGRFEQRIPCADCDGLGFRTLSEADLRDFTDRTRNMRNDAYELARAGERDVSGNEHLDLKQRARQREKGLKVEGNIEEEYRALRQRSICGTCRGSCYVERAAEKRARPDPMFTTVSCEHCRGTMSTVQYGRWEGSSSGRVDVPAVTTRVAGHDVELAPATTKPCPNCVGRDGDGDGYVVPITARPTVKGGEDFGNYVEVLEDVPVHHRPKKATTDTPRDFLAALERADPLVAAATIAYLGPHGEHWKGQRWGRAFALWPLTQAGARLVEEASATSSEANEYARQLSVLEQERIAEIQADTPSERRLALIGMADDEARILEAKVERQLLAMEAA